MAAVSQQVCSIGKLRDEDVCSPGVAGQNPVEVGWLQHGAGAPMPLGQFARHVIQSQPPHDPIREIGSAGSRVDRPIKAFHQIRHDLGGGVERFGSKQVRRNTQQVGAERLGDCRLRQKGSQG